MNKIYQFLAAPMMAALSLAQAAACGDLPASLECPREPTEIEQALVYRGDSHSALVADRVLSQLQAVQEGPVCWVAKGGTTMNNHFPALPLVTAQHCVVWSLATNDMLKDEELFAQTRLDMHAAADEMVDAAAQVWFTVNEDSGDQLGFPQDVRFRWFNEELLAMDADNVRWPNLVVVRWDLASRGQGYVGPDKIHWNEVGQDAWIETILDAAAMCPPPPAPATMASDRSGGF